ncbi:MAG: enoyl-CoA hydratase [Acidimicrobiia bacterium]
MVLRTSLSDGVLHCTLDRPERYNAIDAELREALVAVFAGTGDDGVRAVLVSGAGKGFCAGGDLKEGGGAPVAGVGLERRMTESSQRLARAVLACRLPVVAAVHGACAGIGLTLALGADLCFAAEDARFVSPFVARGIVPDGATARLLPRIIGYARARELLLLGKPIGASEAVELGMVAGVVPAADLLGTALAAARELAALPTEAIGYTKALLHRSFELDLESFLFEERAVQALLSTEQRNPDTPA